VSDDLPVLIVGDVHGDLERLFQALKRYPADRWRTIFVGDLVDGCPFGVGALRYARDRLNSSVLLGNHEVLMLAALAERQSGERGPRLTSWLGVGGQLHDLAELARDEPLQAWVRERPAVLRLEDGTLVQHSDSDNYARLLDRDDTDPVASTNAAFRKALEDGEFDLLWDLLSPQHIFERQPMRLSSWLGRTGARRVVHGHTPHGRPEPYVYASGRAINFDGGLARRNPRRKPSPLRASVGPLDP
jgi:hypothetical protein